VKDTTKEVEISDGEYMVKLRHRFPMRKWLDTIPCKLTMAQLVTLCPSFGKKMADKIDDLSTRPTDVRSVAVAWHLPVTMHGHNLAALLDTGSSLTLIGEDCANRLGLRPTECKPITMRMANDTKAIATKYLPAACITVGNMQIPARVIIMPGVSYDLLLGKDFLSATRAVIGMEENTAKATLTWDGIQQTFSLTDDFGEYGLVGDVTEDTAEFEMEENKKVINPQIIVSRSRGLIGNCVYRIISACQGIFRGRRTTRDNQKTIQFRPKGANEDEKEKILDKIIRDLLETPVHKPVWTLKRNQTQYMQEQREQRQSEWVATAPTGEERKEDAIAIKQGAQTKGYPGAQNWNDGPKMSTNRTDGHPGLATRFRKAQDRQRHRVIRASLSNTSTTDGWRSQPSKSDRGPLCAVSFERRTEGLNCGRPTLQPVERATPAKVRSPVRGGHTGTHSESTAVEKTDSASESESSGSGRCGETMDTAESPEDEGVGEDMMAKAMKLEANERMRLTKLPRYLRRSAYVRSLIEDQLEDKVGKDAHQAFWKNKLQTALPTLYDTNFGPEAETCGVTHVIKATGRPPKTRAYNLPPKEEEVLRKEIDRMLAEGVIRPAMSPYAAGLVLVPKKNGKTRVCTDYRKLNEQTEKDAYPLPLMEDLLEKIAGHERYTTLDLDSGYWQIPMDPESISKTAFTCKFGTFEYLRMPFGLTNAPATFQRTMDEILDPFIREGLVVVYLDDICIMSKKAADHERDVMRVCEKLAEHRMKLSQEKCHFDQPSIAFLGHKVDYHGIHTDAEKCKSYINWGTPKNTRDVRAFMGAVGYYRRFIPQFAEPVAILARLLKKNERFEWKEEHQTAMDKLKKYMANTPVLRPPDFRKPFMIVTDASDFAIGGALMQMHEGREHPVRYWSRTLQPAERNYHTTEKEALAVVQCMKQFRMYVLGSKTVVYTDHQALKQVLTMPKPSGRVARWAAALMEYDFDIRHRPGTKNVLADSLSRDPALRSVTVEVGDRDIDDLLVDVKKYLCGQGELIAQPTGWSRRILKLAGKTYVKNNELYFRKSPTESVLAIISKKRRRELLQEVHDGTGHFGEKTTLDFITNIAWWPEIRKDTLDYVQSCSICQAYARLKKPEPAISIPVEKLFERFALDFVGPLPTTTSGNSYIIVATEALTRWPIAKAVPCADADEAAKFFYEDIVLQFGPPDTILTDRGTHFLNMTMERITEHLQTHHLRTTAYHPQANGMTERFNGTLCAILSKISEGNVDDWDLYIPAALYAYRIRTHTALGKSPFEAMYGQIPKLTNGELLGPESLDEDDRGNNQNNIQQRARRPQIKKRSIFQKDQQVMWKVALRRNKMEPALYGPYTITSCGPNNTYIIANDDGVAERILISGDRLRLYKPRARSRKGGVCCAAVDQGT
jgi:RNase H-like domain found in reverse transcriptase/Reverse transcriptase (RNA-dependent DNA polymerase)/Integrase zinc binding domain/gag-polyprotein putative aspartyl protease